MPGIAGWRASIQGTSVEPVWLQSLSVDIYTANTRRLAVIINALFAYMREYNISRLQSDDRYFLLREAHSVILFSLSSNLLK